MESIWYRHHPDRLLETDNILTMWVTAITAASKIGPDVCVRNKKTNTCFHIEVSCPADGNIVKKQAENLTKCSDFRVEISCMWQCRTLVVPWCWERCEQCTPVLHGGWTLFQVITTCSTQKTVLLGSSLILHKVLSDNHDGLSTSKAGFASGAEKRPYELD